MGDPKLAYTKENVYENVRINDSTFKIVVKGKFEGTPGQFYMLRAWAGEPLLSRPISIHNLYKDRIEFMYQVVGEGTNILKKLKPGDEIELTGPLGNGFDVSGIKGRVAIVAGGIGTAPMSYLAKSLKGAEITAYYGFRDQVFCVDEIRDAVREIRVSTEDGSQGHKGYVTEILEPELYDMVLCCGPEAMMKRVVDMCLAKNVNIFVSMEKHMACGIGACLVCTCQTKSGNKRTCKDGPVFKGADLIF
ncbi:MAG: dihydroorotate dehydrogenase electron transfer subunit [Clostridiaceae bacterium]